MLYLLIWYISLDKHFQVQIKCLGIDCPRNGISSALCCMFFFSCNVCPWPLFCWHWTIPQSTTSALIWRGLNCRFCVVESGAKSRYDSVGQLGLSLGVNDFNFRWSEPYHSTSWTLRFYRWNLIFLEGETFRWIFHKTFTPGFFLALALIFTISLVMLVSLILELLEVNNSCWFKVDDEIIAEKDDLFVQSRLLESKYKFSKEDVTKEDWPEFSFWSTNSKVEEGRVSNWLKTLLLMLAN